MKAHRSPFVLVSPAALRALPDERLAELARDGSEAAFEVIVARHRRSLVRLCAQILGEADAEGAVQEALLKAHAAIIRGDQVVRTVAPWLRTIARSTGLNMLRARGSRPTVPNDDGARRGQSCAGGKASPSPSRHALGHELVEHFVEFVEATATATATGSGETALTGTTLSSASAAVIAAVPGGTVDRATTETDGTITGAAYEVHVTKPDGSHVVVIEDASFTVLSTSAATGHGSCAGGPGGPSTTTGATGTTAG